MKKDIAEFVYACLVCQKSNIEHQKPSGLMQLLFVLEWKWASISIDFVGALPNTVKGFDSIWVIVDRLTKSTHFVSIKTGMTVGGWQRSTLSKLSDCMVFLLVLC